MYEKPANPADTIRSAMDEQLERIRAALRDRKITAVSEATGLHRNTIHKLTKGETPSFSTIQKLSSYLFG